MSARMFASFVCCLMFCNNIFAEQSMLKKSLRYHEKSGRFFFEPDGTGEVIARADYINVINQTGWAYLRVETMDTFPDYAQAYSAGVLEGFISRDLINMHWTNTMAGYCSKPYSKYCAKLSDFLAKNLDWMKVQIQKDKAASVHQPFWHQVGGDLDDLEPVLGDSNISRPIGSGSCSALVKLLAGNADLYVAQDTWNVFQSMLRILKVYNFPWKTLANESETIPGRIQAFSSYPGVLLSGDDYYLLSSGLVSMETTIGNNNPDLWKFVTASTVLEGIRSVVANRLATSGSEWANTFAIYNSGTYNNEWMIVDYKRFQPGMKTLPPGVLTVLDQIPGSIKSADLTDLLNKQGYFSSYNVAYFPEIFNASGNQAMVQKYGDWFTHDKTPRALIFKRDHVKVNDLESMTKLMRYNDFTHDPLSRCNCTPPYSGENAISARSDLNPSDGVYPFSALGHRLHGGVDMKLTSSGLFKDLTFSAVGGPTWDQLPPFQWSKSDFNSTSHIGHPDLWKFSPITFNSTAIFGRL